MSDAEWSSQNPRDLPGAEQSLEAMHGQGKHICDTTIPWRANIGSGSGLSIDFEAETWRWLLALHVAMDETTTHLHGTILTAVAGM